MSQGLSLLKGIIDNGNRTNVSRLQRGLFTEDEIPAFEFFSEFYRRYGAIPSLQQMREGGYVLPPAIGQLDYMFDRCVGRAVYNAVREGMADVQTNLQRQNTQGIRDAIAAIHFDINQHEQAQQMFSAMQASEIVMAEYAAAHNSPDPLLGVTMGWDGLDDLTSGAQGGEVVTWVARPNVGKSFTMARVATKAWDQGKSVLFVTMEMTVPGMMRRMLGMMTGVNPDFIKRGQMSMFGERMVQEVIDGFEQRPPFQLFAGNLSCTPDRVDALVQEHDPDLVVVDAQYLMEPTKKSKGATKQWENLSEVGKEMTAMALSRNKPLHQSVQFNRSQKKDSKGDELANIGGTDVVGQISSIVVAISEGETPNESRTRKLDVVKNRDGDKGAIYTNFLFEPMNFDEIEGPNNADEELDLEWMV